MLKLKRKTAHKIKDWYVANFKVCRKCGMKIEPKDGYWYWQNKAPLKGGYYHSNCGMMNNSSAKGYFPFSA